MMLGDIGGLEEGREYDLYIYVFLKAYYTFKINKTQFRVWDLFTGSKGMG